MSIESHADLDGLREVSRVTRLTLDALKAGHGVGRNVHEEPSVPNHYDARQADVLTDGWTLRTADRSLAAHYEHTIVITRGAPLVLTAA